MDRPALKIRRGRRQDFAAVMRLLAPAEEMPADRRTLRRFRHIVADLGNDLYVAEFGQRLVGVIHASYARQLKGPQRARIEDLAVDPECAPSEVARSLLEFMLVRARRRSCAILCCVPGDRDETALAESVGLLRGEVEYRCAFTGEA